MQMIGAFYQCYQNPVNFLRSVKSYREYYPDAGLIVHSDGGNDYSRICQRYNASYIHHQRIEDKAGNLVYTSVDPILRYLNRLWYSFEALNEPFTIILEDDVRILRHHTSPFLFDINGCNRQELLPETMRAYLPNQEHFYGACGGCVLRKSFFTSIPLTRVEGLMRSIRMSYYASDQCLTFITRLYGGTIGDYPEFAEEWYPTIDQLKKENKVSFLHSYKTDYKDVFSSIEESEINSL
jgi:hypothetical protein